MDLPNFKGLPFDSFPDEAARFRLKWKSLWDYFRTYIQRDMTRNRERAQPHIEKLKNEKMLCPYEFSKLMSPIATHPPRLPPKPKTSYPPRLPSKPT